jgi:hypothetical protein
MTGSNSSGAAGRRVEIALQALARYRELRAADGAIRTGRECLLERARALGEEEPRRRREELVEDAVAGMGLSRAEAEEVYDIAAEEGLDPAFAFELVRCGVAVYEPGGAGPVTAPGESSMRAPPEWLAGPAAPPADVARRERRLRTTFRRLRSLLERYPTPEQALEAFAEEEDVGEYEY